ncbi:MAG TPA: YXWGXW repeat-containing protein [Steroidobacteraceae bacterium]|jgi:hypothetical protein
MRYAKILALIPALLLCCAPTLSQAAFGIGVSVNIAPPELPVYVQPPLPAPGYLWTPGYWAWDGMDYYWVPGTWVEPPASDMLWTPGYWGWNDGLYVWNQGYWGPQVGFYGGVNYGFGYTGQGYQGGYWHGGAFFYNRSVANFGHVNIVNVYNTPVRQVTVSHVSFNGGAGGVQRQPTQAERRAMSAHHAGPTALQRQQQQRAASMPAMHRGQNGGHPQILTTQRAGDFAHAGPGAVNHGAVNHHAAAPEVRGPAMRAEPANRSQVREDGAPPQHGAAATRGPGGQPHQQAPHPKSAHEKAPRAQGEHEPERRAPEEQHDR